MIHEILPVGMLQCNCSIFGDETTRQAMVVDPGDEIARILETLARHSLTVTAIVITHAHIDHIGGAQKLKLATGAPVYMNLQDSELQEMLDVQAGWLGMPTPDAVAIDEVRVHIESLTPLRRIGDVGDIALACLYLASDAGKYVTGKILEVDGGCVSSNADIGLPDL